MPAQKTRELPDIPALLVSYKLSLTAARLAPGTIKSYTGGVHAFLHWAEKNVEPPIALSKLNFERFMVHVLATRAATTGFARHLACRRFSAWMAAEGEIDTDPLVGLKTPKIDEIIVDPLTDGEVKAMIQACQGSKFNDVRDEAIIRLMAVTASRSGEVCDMGLADVQLADGMATIHRGKGGKPRIAPFDPHTAMALDRYIRVRRRHKLAATPQLWLGANGTAFGHAALGWALRERAKKAGVKGFYPHRLRHTGADRWLAKGGSEGGLMAIAGWESPKMLRRYTKRRAGIRAIEESRRLNLGEY